MSTTTVTLTQREANLRQHTGCQPSDPLLLLVRDWLYDNDTLNKSIASFIEKNQNKYCRDPDAELWNVSMVALHREFCHLMEESLQELLDDNETTEKEFEKSITAALRNDTTSDDSTIVKLLVAATQFQTFDLLLEEAHRKNRALKHAQHQKKLAEYHASGGKVTHSKNDIGDHHMH